MLFSKIISPLELNTSLFNKPNADSAVIDFPDPDSPTIPKDSPLSKLKDIFLIRFLLVFFKSTVNFLYSSILMMIFH